MDSRELVDKLYKEVILKLQGYDFAENTQEYDEWSAEQQLSDTDINAMYDEYIARKEA